MHPAELSDDDLIRQCEVTRQRRGGPGGQHRNKVETAIILHHLSTGLTAEANERRSQIENRRVALQRLRMQLAIRVRSASSSRERPSEAWQTSVVGTRLNASERGNALPILIAELLDWLSEHDYEMNSAAERFGVSASQLVKLLRKHPPALQAVNEQRQQRGIGSLK